MATMQRHLLAVAALFAALAFPAGAQRGGGARGGSMGHSAGFASHGAPAFRGSSTFAGRPSFAAPSYTANRYSSSPRYYYPSATGRVSSLGAGSRPGYYRGSRYRRPYGVGVPYSAGWVGLGYPGYLDDSGFYQDPGFYDDSTYAEPPAPAPGVYSDQGYPPPPVDQGDPGPPPGFRPAYQGAPAPAPDPGTEAAVTLIFKNGSTEQIHNYMLTRSTLFVQSDTTHRRLREIPVDDLDLAATQKINKQDGIDFQLPASN
jgi:hypothetical protein